MRNSHLNYFQKNTLHFRHYDYFIIFIFFATSFWLSQQIFMGWDVSWHIEAARQIIENVHHGKNIFDDNPPMVFWFFIPTVLIHHLFGISFITLCLISAQLLVLISFMLCNVYLKDIFYDSGSWEIRIIRYAIIISLLFFSIPQYAQREMLLTAFCLPYCILVSARTQTHSQLHFNHTYLEAFIGLWMGIGIALNPMFGIIAVALEIQYWIGEKKLKLIRPEVIAFITTCLLYLCLIGAVFPKYFTKNILSFFVFSPGCNATFLDLIYTLGSISVGFAMLLFLASRIDYPRRSWLLSLWLCTVTSYAIFLLNQKTWFYHVFPAIVFATLLSITTLYYAFSNKRKIMTNCSIGLLSIITLFSIFLCEFTLCYPQYLAYKNPNSTLRQLINFFNTQPKYSTVVAFSTRLFPVFPLIDYTPLHYLSSFPDFWILPKALEKENPSDTTDWKKKWAVRYKKIFINQIATDIALKKPNYVIIDISKKKPYLGNRKFNYIDFLSQNALFQKYWGHYHLQKIISHYAIYQYRKTDFS